jgi:hypothetical protein
MSLRFLILNTDYSEFLHWLYGHHPGLEELSYEEQMQIRNESLFGVADFYSSNLRKLGHEAYDVHSNNELMQRAWAREHGIRAAETKLPIRKLRSTLRRVRRFAGDTAFRSLLSVLTHTVPSLGDKRSWFHDILTAQVKYYAPDILLNQSMDVIDTKFLRETKPHLRLLVGQHAATPLPRNGDWRCYDLVVSSFPPTVQWFREKGIPTEMHRLGFEPKVLSRLKQDGRVFDVTFIGSLYRIHSSRTELLESLCSRFGQMRIWGPGVGDVPAGSPIRRCYVRQAWGKEMYQVLHGSKVTLNHHGDVAPYANNMRLFEATGVGAMLVTDWKMNLHEMFEPGKEVVAYRSPEECVELVQYYLEHDKEREAIARAGQERTLREHTYHHRMQELVEIIAKYL